MLIKTPILLLYSLFVLAAMPQCESSVAAVSADTATYDLTGVNDSLLNDIQGTIDQTFVQAITSKSVDPLSGLSQELKQLYKDKQLPIIQYWQAYTDYYTSIFYLQQEDEKGSKSAIKNGISTLEEVRPKNSEVYALLALMQSFSIQFSSGMTAGNISSKVRKNGQKAIDLDPKNLRAYYVLGSSNFYTPEKYGGGKKVEEYMTKAVALPDQQIESPYLPSWGKNNAFELLIKHFIKKGEKDKAKQYFKQAVEIYPNDYVINQLAKELI